MHWLDGFSFDDNLISGHASGSNGEASDSNQRRKATAAAAEAATPTRTKRRRHAHFKLNSRLDRKSSRGMIYENEELRLRTININAEVERGQSDIKRLRRENEHLRREIWTLRDECDRLNKRFKAKLVDHEHGGCNARHSGGSAGCTRRGSNGACDSHSNSDDSDSCDTCRGDNDDDECSDECCRQAKGPIVEEPLDGSSFQSLLSINDGVPITVPNCEELGAGHGHFDHLSVVSEETLSNSELLAPHSEHLLGYTPDINGSPNSLPSLVRPLTPLTPIELVANQLNDLQAMVPPLSYFENIVSQQHMGSNIGNTSESGTSPSTGSTVRHTNGWDYNLESPFAQRKLQNKTTGQLRSPSQQQQPQRTAAPTLTTFASPTSIGPDACTGNGQGAVSASVYSRSIETVAITTMPANTSAAALTSPKHFFAPLKPRLKLNTTLANKTLVAATVPSVPPPPPPTKPKATTAPQNFDPPDIFVANALASPYQRQALLPAAATPPPLPQRTPSQTDSVNLKCILNEIENISEDILAIQLEKNKSRENLTNVPNRQGNATPAGKPLQQEDKNKKPYRSEMNLMLSYDGANATITPAVTTAAATQTSLTSNGSHNGRRTRSLEREREQTDSPSPHVPDAMAPFPDNRTYIGFDQLNSAAPRTGQAPSQKPPLPPSQVVAGAKPSTPQKPSPPLPPTRMYPPPLNMRRADMARASSLGTPTTPQTEATASSLAPNKSHLYTAIANAAAKRAQFRAAPAHLTRSLDTDLMVDDDTGPATLDSPQVDVGEQCTQAADAARRKARRVSIVCGDSNSSNTPEHASQQSPLRTQAQGTSNFDNKPTTINPAMNPATGSYVDLTAMSNPALKHLKQASSHSTPNSPHSSRRRINSNNMAANMNGDSPTAVSAGATPHHNHGHQHSHSNTSGIPSSALQRKNSQDSTRGNCADLAAAAAIVARSKCSRRHSDGTVAVNNAQRISGGSHHHHHHHHQHSSSLLGNSNPHHSHHSHQDSNQETGTSVSDHNTNSLASSRESSTTFSMRSQRRKISISSHTGGKIPWCGCWGNGCL